MTDLPSNRVSESNAAETPLSMSRLAQRSAASLEFWSDRLAGLSVCRFSPDYRIPRVQKFYRQTHELEFGAILSRELQALEPRGDRALSNFLIAALNVLLLRQTQQEDIVIGTLFKELDAASGTLHCNPVALRCDLAGDPTGAEVLERVAACVRSVEEHGHDPFDDIVEALGGDTNAARAPVFQTMILLDGRSSELCEVPLTNDDLQAISRYSVRCDLVLRILIRDGCLVASAEYDADLFTSRTIARLLNYFQWVCRGLLGDRKRCISDLPLSSASERQERLRIWHLARADSAKSTVVHERFRAQAAATPEADALVLGNASMSYGDLDRRSSALARRLQALGVRRNDLVGVDVERSMELIVGILGILKAGGAYLPLDPHLPAERMDFMLRDSKASVVLTDGLGSSYGEHITSIAVDDAIVVEQAEYKDEFLPGSRPDDLAYVIYTSGSTGRPKGVKVTHRNVARLMAVTEEIFRFSRDDVWTLFHSCAFDFSVWEMFGALFYGGRLVIVPHSVTRSPEAFYALLDREDVTVLNQTPSAFRQLCRVEEEPEKRRELRLRYIIFGGEALDYQSLNTWVARHGDETPQLVNMYGITETTVHATYHRISRDDLGSGRSVIGRPLSDLSTYVLDRSLQPVPIGIPGELHIAGPGVTGGYLDRPELSRDRFRRNPFSSDPWHVIYLTGDMVREGDDGRLEYLGRRDRQIKLRGFRIEPEEIERVLLGHPDVREAAVAVRTVDSAEPQLAAFVGTEPGRTLNRRALREFLSLRLPEYMVPASIATVQRFPLTPNGKIDYRALLRVEVSRPELDSDYVAPRSAVERRLAAIWKDVLNLAQVGVHEDFLELGGDSIRAIQLLSRAKDAGLELKIQDLHRSRTLAALARVAVNSARGVPAVEAFGLVSSEERARLSGEIEDAYPLAALQLGMLFHSEFDSGSSLYHNVTQLRVRMPFAHDAFRVVLDQVSKAHPVLRTSFDLGRGGRPLQLVHRSARIPLEIVDLRDQCPEAQERELEKSFDDQHRRRFRASDYPLLRLRVHILGEKEICIELSEHHAILDGWSVASLVTELLARYASLFTPSLVPVDATPTASYRDFVALEMEAAEHSESWRFWERGLEDATLSRIPRWPPAFRSGSAGTGDLWESRLPHALCEQLRRLASSLHVPLRILCLAAHVKVVSTLTNHAEVVTGVVTNGRPEHGDGDRVLGLFLNTLPFRVSLGRESWADLIRSSLSIEQECIPHRRVPLAELQRRLGGRSLFETVFNFTDFHVYESLRGLPEVELGDTRFRGKTNYPLTTHFDVLPSGEIALTLRYDSAEVAHDQAEALAGYYLQALTDMLEHPYQPHARKAILPPRERHRILVDWNVTGHKETLTCLDGQVDAQAMRAPKSTAVRCEGATLTYGELVARANSLAAALNGRGIGPESQVGLFLEPSLHLIVGILAVMKAGAAYVPLEPGHPAGRLNRIVRDADLSVMLTTRDLRPRLPASGRPTVLIERTVDEDGWGGSRATLSTLAYILYTSGSTGTPNGVAVEHRQLAAYTRAMIDRLSMTPGDRFALVQPLSVDSSVTAIFPTLATGGEIHLVSRETYLDAWSFAAYLRENDIDHLKIAPSHLRALAEEVPTESLAPRKTLVIGGEVSAWRWMRGVRGSSGGCRVFNHYGPTETTVGVTTYEVDSTPGEDGFLTTPIGRPIASSRIYILDRFGEPTPVGVPGELCIGGSNVARGYWRRRELTEERFPRDPFSATSGARMYRSGDRARYLPDGNIEFLGRTDHQVKVQGYRVELGEIESQLRRHPAIAEVAVCLGSNASSSVEVGQGDQGSILAFVVHRRGSTIESASIRRWLKDRLPAYMVPIRICEVDYLSRTAHGKIDRSALPRIPEIVSASAAYQPARTREEKSLCRIWGELLPSIRVGIHDDFFELGGDSITCMQVVARAMRAGLQLTPRQVFDNPTVAELAIVAAPLGAPRGNKASPGGFVPMTPAQIRFLEQDPIAPAHHNQSRLFETPFTLDQECFEQTLREVVRHHHALRARFLRKGSGWRQSFLPSEDRLGVEVIDLSKTSQADAQRKVADEAARLHGSLDLESGPMLRSALFHLGSTKPTWVLLILHHLIVDEVSWRILLDDLEAVYSQILSREAPRFPPETTPVHEWTTRIHHFARSTEARRELGFWTDMLAGATRFPVELDGPNTEGSTARISVSLSRQETQSLLRESPKAYGCRITELLLTALARALADRIPGRTAAVDVESHGREPLFEDVDLSRTIGWFTNVYPVVLDLDSHAPIPEAIRSVKEQLRRLPRQGVAFGALAYLDPMAKERLAREVRRGLCFNYLGQLGASEAGELRLRTRRTFVGPDRSTDNLRTYEIEVSCVVLDGKLHSVWIFSENRHRRETVTALAEGFVDHLRNIVAHCSRQRSRTYTPSDFPASHLGSDSLRKLLAKLGADEGEDSA